MIADTHQVFSARGKLYKIFHFTSHLFVDLHCNIQQQQHNFMTKTRVSSAFFGFETSMLSLCTTILF